MPSYDYYKLSAPRIASLPDTLEPETQRKIDQWLAREEISLRFDPFRSWQAESDPYLSYYLVDHGAFRMLMEERPSFLYAPVGGGKTAFRVRLTHACRTGETRRRIFPIPLVLSNSEIPLETRILNQAASELLLHAVFFPRRILGLPPATQVKLRQTLQRLLPEENTLDLLSQVEHQIKKIVSFDDWWHVARIFDRSASQFAIPPSTSEVDQVLAILKTQAGWRPVSEDFTRDLSTLTELLQAMGYQAIFLLVDGLTKSTKTQHLPMLLKHLNDWMDRDTLPIHAKFFLLAERDIDILSVYKSPLTEAASRGTIQWNRETLQELIENRLRVASHEHLIPPIANAPDVSGSNDGDALYATISSLDALSTPGLLNVESQLLTYLESVGRLFPRDVIALVEYLFGAHVVRVGPQGRLEPEDLKAAITSYEERLLKPRSGPL